MMFNVLVLLVYCATIASKGATAEATIAPSQSLIVDSVVKPNSATIAPAPHPISGDRRTVLSEIRLILEKLYFPSEIAPKYNAHAPVEQVIEDALKYAHWYWVALDIGYEEASVVDRYHRTSFYFWDQESFDQRVKNFHRGHLPPLLQYHAMGKVLVKLLELVQRAWGGRRMLKEAERRSGIKPAADAITYIKNNLEAKIKALCNKYQINDFTPQGWPFNSLLTSPGDEWTLSWVFNRFFGGTGHPIVEGQLQTQSQTSPPSAPVSEN